VNEPVPECNDLAPDIPRAIAHRRRQAGCGLADDLEISDYRILDEPLLHQGIASACHVVFDGRDAVRDVSQIGQVAFHKGSASARMYGRK
jgi:hypothetical protein